MAAVSVPLPAQQSFTITDLGTLGGSSSFALGSNDRGDVVGYSQLPGDVESHAFLWRAGVMMDLGTLGPEGSYALDVNADGHVVGVSSPHPFVWREGVMTTLPLLAGHTFGIAVAINDAGQIVGTSGGHAVTWIDEHVVPLVPPAGPAYGSTATGINKGGLIVGYAGGPEFNRIRAVLWEDGVARYLQDPPLPGCPAPGCLDHSLAWGINDRGEIAGVAYDAEERGYIVKWVNGTPMVLPNGWRPAGAAPIATGVYMWWGCTRAVRAATPRRQRRWSSRTMRGDAKSRSG